MAARSPIVFPSSELDAHLHDKVVESKHPREVSFGNHDNDLMTPPNVLLEAALKKAENLNNQKMSETAIIEEWVRCVALSRIVHGDSHWLLAKCHVQLARAYLELKGLPEQALLHAKMAHDILLSLGSHVTSHDPPEATLSLAVAHWVIGTAQTQLGNLSEAHRYLLKAEKYSESYSKMSGANTRLDLDIVSSMGRLCVKQSKPSIARDCFKKALDLSRAMFGPKSSRLVPLLKELASTELLCVEKEGAVEQLQEALDITQQDCSFTDSHQTAELLVALARANAVGGTTDSAVKKDDGTVEDLLERACSLYHSLGSDVLAINCKEELCHYLITSKSNHEQVIPMLKEVISGKKVAFGDYSQELADTLRLLGTLYLTLGDLTQARKYLLKAMSAYGQSVGMKHKDAISVSQTLELISRGPGSDPQHKPRFKTVC